MYKITIIIPLLDRNHYVKIWMKNNIRDDFYYIFADGSHNKENENYFSNIKLKNVKYIKYQPDKSAYLFTSKIYKSISYAKTEYIMTSDDDDFLNYKGIIKCIDFLNNNKDYICASGMISKVINNHDQLEFKKMDNIKYKIYPEIINQLKNLDNKIGLNGVKTYLNKSINTNYLWYAVFRKKEYEKIWYDLKQSNISDTDFIEILHTCLTFYYGRYKFLKCIHYIRLVNTINNNTSLYKIKLKDRLKEDTRTIKSKFLLINILNEKFNYNKFSEIVNAYFENNKSINIKYKFLSIFLKRIIQIFNTLTKFYNITTIRHLLNLFVFLNLNKY